MACLAFAQISVENVSADGFSADFSIGDYPGKGYWMVHDADYMPLDKEIIYGITSYCNGKVRGASRTSLDVQCALESGKSFEISLLVINKDQGTRFSQKLQVQNRRRLLESDVPTASPLTSAPTATPTVADFPSHAPTKSPHTSAPTSPAGSISPSQSPSGMPSLISQTDSPTQATIPVQTTSLEPEEDDSTFLGMDFGSSSDQSMFIIFLTSIIFVLFMVLFAPGLYRKYYASTDDELPKSGSKTKVAEISKSELTSATSESVIDVVCDKKMTTLNSKVWREPVE